MALIKRVSYTGQPNISTFNGRVGLDFARNKIKATTADGKTVIDADSTGLDTYDADGKNMLHSGYDPDGTAGVTAIARQGEDAIASS